MTTRRGIIQDIRTAIADLDSGDVPAARSRLYELIARVNRFGIAQALPIVPATTASLTRVAPDYRPQIIE